ncbi:MAG: isoprenylcysteine carboxylmethyltransferase family protein [Candidatus Methanoperedens sp.]|nr:isoprenylcysteine carboxylmethyltransferase family protein [Candidatus Methanoperedens sp.]MCZ7396622.1 isoprenylcysteine carboxylmethyltransferase family protein [Candidatus Methanoperedens sp.]
MNIIISFILYFLVFAGLHSLLAADYIKDKGEKLLGKGYRFYRIMYTIISFLTFAPAFFIWVSFTGSTPLVYSLPESLYPVIILIRLGALGMFVYASYQTDVLEFMGIRQKAKNILITGGAYGIVRHPLYTGGILLLFTKMEMSQLDIIAVLLVSIYLIIGAFIEERRLLSVFGEEYRKYQQQVSMLIPVKRVMRMKSKC